MFYFDSSFIILIPALLVAIWAQYKVSSTFNKYSRYRSHNGYTGAQVARMLLDGSGLYDVPVELIPGKLSDHYDPSRRVMRLSEDVYYGNSVASIGVAAHETGHAIQHKNGYVPLVIRNSIVPVVNFGSNVSWILFLAGFVLGIKGLVNLGIILFALVVLFQIITLPVELNASRRALKILEGRNILYSDELDGARSVLSAAAMTYVAAVLTAIANLLRLIYISRDRN
ncbi:zinc metallopeptidase [Clostridium sp. MT-14]|uniref:Zinc metallopeptidase n=1 Tax=Clostridium aromativorans TaxID=2836848 RepID=A0ABS8N4D9_9CLOT|nr:MULTISPECIES: zinc metallopeptidase [Clostridium]KAA8677044.1 zinc metallopeptidase [Clostridium sp. HV4-5-A1G]MCC9294673.1 zinc metallopeptidase [Clostridium aromativorans]CAB1243597.1 putative metal-dependent protease/peptidase [Clostridiaceae bacterium BL-3]